MASRSDIKLSGWPLLEANKREWRRDLFRQLPRGLDLAAQWAQNL